MFSFSASVMLNYLATLRQLLLQDRKKKCVMEGSKTKAAAMCSVPLHTSLEPATEKSVVVVVPAAQLRELRKEAEDLKRPANSSNSQQSTEPDAKNPSPSLPLIGASPSQPIQHHALQAAKCINVDLLQRKNASPQIEESAFPDAACFYCSPLRFYNILLLLLLYSTRLKDTGQCSGPFLMRE